MAHCAGSSRSRPRQDHRPDRTRRQSPPLWAANPELHSKEDGTAQQSNRYMTETASYLTQTEGGGSISMHLRPHIKAYQKPNGSPMGVIKYLDPRRAPHGRGGPESYTTTRPSAAALSSHSPESRDNHKNRIDHLPDTCIFLRACFQSFHELRVYLKTPRSSPTNLSASPSSGATTDSRSLVIGLDRAHAQEWIDYSQCPLCLNTIIRYASYSRKSAAWIDERQRERPLIIGDIPSAPSSKPSTHPLPRSKTATSSSQLTRHSTPNATHVRARGTQQEHTDGGPDALACGTATKAGPRAA